MTGGTLKVVKITIILEERRENRDGTSTVLERWQYDAGAGSHSLKTAFEEAAEKQNAAVTRLCADMVTGGPLIVNSEGKEN